MGGKDATGVGDGSRGTFDQNAIVIARDGSARSVRDRSASPQINTVSAGAGYRPIINDGAHCTDDIDAIVMAGNRAARLIGNRLTGLGLDAVEGSALDGAGIIDNHPGQRTVNTFHATRDRSTGRIDDRSGVANVNSGTAAAGDRAAVDDCCVRRIYPVCSAVYRTAGCIGDRAASPKINSVQTRAGYSPFVDDVARRRGYLDAVATAGDRAARGIGNRSAIEK